MKKALWKLLKSLLLFVLSLFLLSAAVFYVSRLAPGDPLVSYYGERVEKMSPEQRAWAEARLGLDQPISTQYVRWLGQALKGDFGISYKYKMDVLEVISSRVGNTLILGVDAHAPEQFADPAVMDDCCRWAAQFGLPMAATIPMEKRNLS